MLKEKLKFFGLGLLAAVCGTLFAQTQILDLDVLGTLDVTADAPQLFITETDAAADNGIWLQRAVSEQFIFEACTDALSCVDIMQVDRTGSTVDTVNFLPTNLQHNGTDVSALATDSGTFTVTVGAGCTTNPSGTATYTQIGDIAVIEMPSLACTSNTTTFNASTAAPVSIRPTTSQEVLLGVTDSGTVAPGCMILSTSGGMTWSDNEDCNAVSWTGSGAKAIHNTTVTYLLN